MGQSGTQAPVLDIYLALEARRLKKNITSLETADMYCEVCYFYEGYLLFFSLIK
jgi:hypothetical protein